LAAAVTVVDLQELSLDRGGHLLVEHGLRTHGRIQVRGTDPELPAQVATWCRMRGHRIVDGMIVAAADDRWVGALPSGRPDPRGPDAVAAHADARWGLAARGALVEDGAAELTFPLSDRDGIWDDDAPRLYAQAAAAQWDPATAVPWTEGIEHTDDVEAAVVQVMTYLVENETAAMLVPARFLASVHPHYREVMAFMAIQTADEARHIEVFTRRATLRGDRLGTSSRGGQASLATLVREPDHALATFLLSVLGEGSFLELLRFLHEVGPDPVTRTVARLAAQDEARHVAFAVGFLRRRCSRDPGLRARLATAVHMRHAALQHTSGLNAEVFDALVVLAAGAWTPDAIARGFDRVVMLVERMDRARRAHLVRLGFSDQEAAELSALHTRNFM
jgi:hypothetical protein